MSHQTCETVAIQGEKSEGNPTGIIVVNKSDYDLETMTLAEPVQAQQEPIVPPAPVEQEKPLATAKVVAPWAAP
jgi:hypothetical protein